MILASGWRAGNAWTDPQTGMLTPAAGAWLAELVRAVQTLQTQASDANIPTDLGTGAGSTQAQAAPALSAIPFVM